MPDAKDGKQTSDICKFENYTHSDSQVVIENAGIFLIKWKSL